MISSYDLRCLWLLDPDARPHDLPARLTALGIRAIEKLELMVLPAGSTLPPLGPGIQIVDGLRDLATYGVTERVQAESFGDSGPAPRQRERFEELRSDPTRCLFLALMHGVPAGAGRATVHQGGVILTGGAVVARFRGRGVYLALLAERLALARHAGVPGVVAQAKLNTSAPILARFGFTTVGHWRVHADKLGLI
jgi:hypothetical protein